MDFMFPSKIKIKDDHFGIDADPKEGMADSILKGILGFNYAFVHPQHNGFNSSTKSKVITINDDYYFGKGSSYPDINGSIGILFEQAGYRGRIRETVNGTKTLASGIKNQFTVSLSTLEAAVDLRNELLGLQTQ